MTSVPRERNVVPFSPTAECIARQRQGVGVTHHIEAVEGRRHLEFVCVGLVFESRIQVEVVAHKAALLDDGHDTL